MHPDSNHCQGVFPVIPFLHVAAISATGSEKLSKWEYNIYRWFLKKHYAIVAGCLSIEHLSSDPKVDLLLLPVNNFL